MLEWTIEYTIYNEHMQPIKRVVERVFKATQYAAQFEAERRAKKLCAAMKADYWLIGPVK